LTLNKILLVLSFEKFISVEATDCRILNIILYVTYVFRK